MTAEQRIKNLSVPTGPIDVVLDTDTYNEIDDQFALAYLLRSTEKLNTKAIYAAPFFNQHSEGPADGMERSYEEIKKILTESVDSEDKSKPLTDEELVEVLNHKGYKVARRTVAKYREQLNIPIARLRKEL